MTHLCACSPQPPVRTPHPPAGRRQPRAWLVALSDSLRGARVAPERPGAVPAARSLSVRGATASYLMFDLPTYQRRGLHIPELERVG